ENGGQLVARVADAGEVRNGREGRLAVDADHQVVGPLARRAAGAVGDGDERRLQFLQAGDVGEQLFGRLVGLGREELEAEAGAVLAEDVLNVHGLAAPQRV